VAKTAAEIAAFTIARLEAMEEVLATVVPAFYADYHEITKRNIDASAAIGATAKAEAKSEMDAKRTALKKKSK